MTLLNKLLAIIVSVAILFAVATPSYAASRASKPKAAMCKKVTASGLGYTVIKKAKGVVPGAQDKVTINYRGTLAKDGSEFDANKGARFGVNGVIPGFAEGLQLMPVGSRYRLCIPAKLGYKERALDGIPANSDLIFDVDMVAIVPAPPPTLTNAADKICAQKAASGLGYTILEAGTGAVPTNDHVVLAGYAGYLASDGAKFDESAGAALPVTDVVPGFSEGLKLMNKGGRYRLCIPAALGYGAEVTGPIPANSDLIFLVELLDMRTRAELASAQSRGR